VAVADPQALDHADELAPFRERFHFGEADRAGRIYLDGNSLGRQPLAVREAIEAHARDWGERLVTGWGEWIDAPRRTGDVLAPLLGAQPGEVIACDSVTVNLFKLAAATDGPIAVAESEFPTDRYVLEGLGRELRPLEDSDGAGLVVLSHVDYRTGERADLAAVTAAAHAKGAQILWDVSHSAGVLPIDLAATGADLAVGCTYKYLNAGPGAPAFLYVRGDLVDQLRSPIQGWFGQREQFAMERPYDPAPGIERFLAGTPPIAGLLAVREGARLVAEAGIEQLAAQAGALTDRLIERTGDLGLDLATPREARRRGAHIALRHPDAWRITRALAEAGVIGDFRPPDVLRLGVNPLYTTDHEIDDAADRLREVMTTRAHERLDTTRTRVT
jgi:kynureninase